MLREGGDLWTTEAILSQYRAAREGITATVARHFDDLHIITPRRFNNLVLEMADFLRSDVSEPFRSSEK